MVNPARNWDLRKAVNPAVKLELKKAVFPAIKLELKKGGIRVKTLIPFFFFIVERTEGGIFLIINLRIVRVDTQYCDYLRQYDNKVAYNRFEKELRPFIGILFKIDDFEYFAPLSSPKIKHKNMKNYLDFIKIKNGELGAVNFNNMIPVTENNYSLIDLNKKTLTITEFQYQNLLKEQLAWLNANFHQVKNKSYKLYQLYNSGRLPENIKSRCCNFKLLEEACKKYKK